MEPAISDAPGEHGAQIPQIDSVFLVTTLIVYHMREAQTVEQNAKKTLKFNAVVTYV